MIKFVQKQAIVCAKNANILAKYFGENVFKIITSVPAKLIRGKPGCGYMQEYSVTSCTHLLTSK
jgi:hypothetical protein